MRMAIMGRTLVGGLIAGALLAAWPAAAHDFWIQPETFTPASATTLGIGLFVGDQGAASEVRRWPGRIVRFDAVRPDGATAVPGLARQTPAGSYRTPGAGGVTVVYEGTAEHIELPAEKFEAYLAEEGLEDILAARRRLGESAAPGRERYARSCKSLLRVDGVTDAAVAGTRVGLRIELVAERPPSRVRVPERLPLTLWFEGAPLAGRLVELIDLDDPTERFEARTDADGRVYFPAPPPGRWMAATVHMRRVAPTAARHHRQTDASVVDVEWESFWGTLTFEVPAPPADPALDVEYRVLGGPASGVTVALTSTLRGPTDDRPDDLGEVGAAVALRVVTPTPLGTASLRLGAGHGLATDATGGGEASLGVSLDPTERLVIESGIALGLRGDASDVAVMLGATWLPF